MVEETIITASAISELSKNGISDNTPIFTKKTCIDGSVILTCYLCSEKSNRQFNIVRHYKRFHVAKERFWKCKCCDKEFATKWNFRKHNDVCIQSKRKLPICHNPTQDTEPLDLSPQRNNEFKASLSNRLMNTIVRTSFKMKARSISRRRQFVHKYQDEYNLENIDNNRRPLQNLANTPQDVPKTSESKASQSKSDFMASYVAEKENVVEPRVFIPENAIPSPEQVRKHLEPLGVIDFDKLKMKLDK